MPCGPYSVYAVQFMSDSVQAQLPRAQSVKCGLDHPMGAVDLGPVGEQVGAGQGYDVFPLPFRPIFTLPPASLTHRLAMRG